MWSHTLCTCTAHMHSHTPTPTHTVTLSRTPTALPDTPNTLTCTHPHTNPRQQMGRSGNWLNLFPMSGSALAAPSDRKAGWACTAKPAAPIPSHCGTALEQGPREACGQAGSSQAEPGSPVKEGLMPCGKQPQHL